MNVFVDTSVLYSDPFWKGNYAKLLLDAARVGKLNLYISDVVLKELRKNLKEQVDGHINSLVTANKKLSKITFSHNELVLLKTEAFLQEFDKFYQELFDKKTLIKLPSENDLLSELIDRAVAYKKPFGKGKSEFKDAVIWLTYSKHAESLSLQKCALLTENTNDFSDKSGNIHSDLKEDSDKFDFYENFENYYKKYSGIIIDAPNAEFVKWVDKHMLGTPPVVTQIIEQNVFDNIERFLDRVVDESDVSEFSEGDYVGLLMGGYASFSEILWIECSDIEINIVDNYAIVSGKMDVEFSVELYSYNSVRDPGDERHPYLGTKDCIYELEFNFEYDENQEPRNFELNLR